MLLEYLGHAFFRMTTEAGTVITADPYGEFYSFPKRSIPADVCTISHHHHDHDGLSCIAGNPFVIDKAGKHRPADDVRLTAIPTWHDGEKGTRRGDNLIFVYEVEGLRIVHCGDLGHIPDAAQSKAIGKPDVLLIPVGGYYTIDPQQAVSVMKLLKPTLTIPMHYRTKYNEEMPIQPVDDFLELTGTKNEPCPMLRLTVDDMNQRPPVMVMNICE